MTFDPIPLFVFVVWLSGLDDHLLNEQHIVYLTGKLASEREKGVAKEDINTNIVTEIKRSPIKLTLPTTQKQTEKQKRYY